MKFKYILLITAIVVSLNKTKAQHSLQPTMANLVNNIVPEQETAPPPTALRTPFTTVL